MACIRKFKRDIDYLVSEVVSDCYTCLIINPDKDADKVFDILKDVVKFRDSIICKVNNPEEKHNSRLLKKYYRGLRIDMFENIDKFFTELSNVCKK